MPIPVNRSCSTATAESTWWTPSPPAVPTASVSLPTVSATADTSTAATDDPARMPIWQPDTGGCWCCHHLAARLDNLPPRGRRVKPAPPDSAPRDLSGRNLMVLSPRPPAARAGYDQG